MNAPEPSSSNSVRYFVLGVLCVAVVLGIYFVQLNAQVDREREAANERLALCRQVESIARSLLPNSLDTRETCEPLNGRMSKSATLP
ncbi:MULTISPECIES: hypothetical protein [Pseudomonas]|uniref:Uncharacterized protein n=1 Tax=Pseudomonas tritici TaxID=2745518 RepID=A0A8H9Z0E1_9PSED|nr:MULTISPECIES: hypothetical protein [Pseudomonas]MBP2875120.1 hypothetical protein [Pseudomonas sp. SWRI144]MBW8129679.1 hypothetical protein [Pseudomonas sp. LAP_36]MBW8138632.1 hypothetical protein [Pseudomonas sp. PAMC 26818]QXH86348.1 hypothetical protein HU722_0012970 [Pseudomonas tritici]CRM56635.1 hypothetical protein [Pseudomonas sp. 58 R 12]